MVTILLRAVVTVTALLLLSAPTPSAAAQSPAQAPQGDTTRRLTVDEAVALALEHNLGIQTSRFAPQIEDLAVAQALAAWQPTVNSTMLATAADSPNVSF